MFAALVGISATVSLVIGLVLYYFAQDRLVAQERELLVQRSRTANAGASVFLEGLRDPESGALPAPDTYAEELVRATADPTGLSVLYAGLDGEPLAARDAEGGPASPQETLSRLGLDEEVLEEVGGGAEGEGRLVPVDGGGVVGNFAPGYVAVWPLLGADGATQGVLVYDTPDEGLEETLAFLRYGILGAIGTSVLLASLGSLVLARQITRPLHQTRDAAIRVASGDYSFVPVENDDELGEVAKAFNYMAEEVRHYVGEIQRQKSRLEAVLEASPEAVIAINTRECVTMTNPAAALMLGIGPSSYGLKLSELGAPEAMLDCLREASEQGAAVREVEVGEKTYWAYAARISSASDSAANNDPESSGGTILAVRDITQHRSLERAKTAFVSDVSHELRTPLTTIQSAVHLIERAGERLDPLERRALELADGELMRIRGMVEELSTLAQMDSRQYSLQVAPTDLDEVVRSALDAIDSKAKRFEIGLEYSPDGLLSGRIVCDAQKVYQVMLNLLDNAIKYSDPGARVSVSLADEGDLVLARVADTGVGIPEGDLPQLFERFYRVDKDRSRATGGSGLGLAICKQIVELHGGRLSVESEPGVGSTFTFRLPKNPAPPHAP